MTAMPVGPSTFSPSRHLTPPSGKDMTDDDLLLVSSEYYAQLKKTARALPRYYRSILLRSVTCHLIIAYVTVLVQFGDRSVIAILGYGHMFLIRESSR